MRSVFSVSTNCYFLNAFPYTMTPSHNSVQGKSYVGYLQITNCKFSVDEIILLHLVTMDPMLY